jgi:hypothetical protein
MAQPWRSREREEELEGVLDVLGLSKGQCHSQQASVPGVCYSRQALTWRTHSKALRWSSSGSFVLKEKCSACDQTDLYLFTFLCSRTEPAWAGQRAGFQAVKVVSDEVWNFPVDTNVAGRDRISWDPGHGVCSSLGPLGNGGAFQGEKSPLAPWGTLPKIVFIYNYKCVQYIIFFFFFLAILGFELRVSCLLCRSPTT